MCSPASGEGLGGMVERPVQGLDSWERESMVRRIRIESLRVVCSRRREERNDNGIVGIGMEEDGPSHE